MNLEQKRPQKAKHAQRGSKPSKTNLKKAKNQINQQEHIVTNKSQNNTLDEPMCLITYIRGKKMKRKCSFRGHTRC